MNYLKVYNSIMDRAKFRIFDNSQYFETHHIIPKCMNGSNDDNNLVKLTFREHFLAHWLLYRIYPTNKKIAAAFHISAYGYNVRETRKEYKYYMPSSRSLEEAKMAKINSLKGKKHSIETIEKMKETWKNKVENGYIQKNNKGRKSTEEQKQKISISKIGKKRDDATKNKISETKKRQYQDYLKNNNGEKRKLSDDTIDKIRNKAFERWKNK